MNKFNQLKHHLDHCIRIMDKSSSLFVSNPEKDFSRKRKHSFSGTLLNVLLLESGSLKDELYKLFGFMPDSPSVSSFIQARDKIRPDAFYTLFRSFNERSYTPCLFKGYRLLAIDGSVLPISSEIRDSQTTIPKANNSDRPFSAYHINTSYDLLERTYENVILQGQAEANENGAFNSFVDQYKGNKAIFIADRGYESLNSMVKTDLSGNKYLIRVKDIHSRTSMLRSFGPFPDQEFDMHAERILTSRQTKDVLAHHEIYKFVPKHQRFDYFDENHEYKLNFRVIRVQLGNGTYECIVTNLDEGEFTMQEIKELYHLRWHIETSYREIKYNLDLNTLHAKKRNLIQQEIYAKMILYNFCRRVTGGIHPKKKNRKHDYQLNFVRAFHIIRKFLKEKSGRIPPYVESMIEKEILPVRLHRKNQRKVKPKSPEPFNYRYD